MGPIPNDASLLRRRKVMTITDRYTNYLNLLKIRQSARKRDATFLGAIFLISILGMAMIGLVTGLGNREVYLVSLLNISFGISFVIALARLEIIKGNIELLNNLRDLD
jgi:hypothetical protein